MKYRKSCRVNKYQDCVDTNCEFHNILHVHANGDAIEKIEDDKFITIINHIDNTKTRISKVDGTCMIIGEEIYEMTHAKENV
jgi:hypothetical protein